MTGANGYEISYELTPALVRKAVSHHIWQHSGMAIMLICYLLTGCIVLLLMGHSRWYVFVGMGIGCANIARWVWNWLRAPIFLKRFPDRSISLRVNEAGIETRFADLFSEVNWNSQLVIWTFKELWIIYVIGGRSGSLLPLQVLTDEMRNFIKKKVIENGGQVA